MTMQALKQYGVFITGGGVGALVKWLISFGMTSLLGVHYMAALVVAEAVNVAVNYLWHRTITFNARGRVFWQCIRFVLVSCATVLLSLGLVFVLKEHVLDALGQIVVRGFPLNYLAAIVVVTFAVSLINYCVSRLWVFVGDAGNPPAVTGDALSETMERAEKERA